jgi:DNA-binding Lrp family transcriptional regulator
MSSRRLSLAERKVLFGARFAARESVANLANRLGLRNHVALRALRNLRQYGVIKPYVAVDVSKLGFTDYAVFFSVSPESAKVHRKLVQFLVNSQEVPWVVEFAGEFNYAFSLICRHISHVDSFLLSLGQAVGVEMTNRVVITRTAWSVYAPRFLLPEPSGAAASYEFDSQAEVVKYDELDISLLRLLSAPAGATDAQCARSLGEASATVAYRRTALEKKGVIISYAFSIDPVAIGRTACFFLLQVKTPSPDLRRRILRFAASERDTMSVNSCIGAWDYEFCIAAESPMDIAEFQRRLFDKFSNELVGVRSLLPVKVYKLEPFPSSIIATPATPS